MAVTVEWLGHCAFRLRGEDGPSVLIDPFDDTIGHRVPQYDCDILLISHDHYDSSAKHLVPPGYDLIRAKGTTLAQGIAFNAFPLWHDERMGNDYGSVLIFHFELGGLTIGYLSHIGTLPRQWVLEKFLGLDICFVPVGDVVALGPADAAYLVKQLAPKIVFPMHFQTRPLTFTLLPLGEFLNVMPDKEQIDDWRVCIESDNLPDSPTVLIMRHWPGVAPV